MPDTPLTHPPAPSPPVRRHLTRRRAAPLVLLGALTATFYVVTSLAQMAANQQPLAWQAPLDFNTFNLASGTAVAYRGDYLGATWNGDLVAHDVSAAGVFSVKWRARDQMPAAASRIIFTSTVSGSGAAFRWSSGISAAQQALLGDATTGPKVLDYLRGDKTNEITSSNPYPTGLFKTRYSTMGAVVHSRPYHDNGTVYVGANDGMLHAFNAATGVERFAYVPASLFAGSKLASLSAPYSTSYPYTVDGSLAIGTVGTRKMLFGGLGDGGSGLYAIDITDPAPTTESGAAAMAKWEITSASTGYANLANITAAPQLVKLNTGDTALLVPNGSNSAGKVSSLFVIRASDGVKLAEIAAGSALADGSANALGGISAVDKDGNGTVDVVYAGDLKGTLWRFDLNTTTLPSTGTAVFTPATADLRPITAAPSVSLHPRGGLMVNFGTGQMLTSADLSSTATEYLYGVWDSGSVTAASLVTQTLTNRTVPLSTAVVRTASTNAVSYTGSAKGWRIALSGGERLIGGDTLVDSGRFMVTTSVPNSGSTQGAWMLQVNALTGSAPTAPFFDLNGDGKVSTGDNSDRIAVTSPTPDNLVPVGKFLGTGVWSQPVLAQVSSVLDLPQFNYNPNVALPAYTTVITTTTTSGGVAGGHFDFDNYYSCSGGISSGACAGTHTHEYDDKWNVVGVNMLNASQSVYNLDTAIPSTATSFKILVANTLWSPAATLVVGDTISGVARNLPVSPEGFLSDTPGGVAKTFTRADLTKFIFVLPLNAFTNKDWGTGMVRAGLIPTATGCVHANANPSAAWMDGAFTVQVVKATTANSDVQANVPADSGGYRLKDNVSARANLLAQYTAFWHHPSGKCKTDSGWTMAPAADTSTAGKASTPPAGTADPTGNFESGVSGGTGGGAGTTVKNYVGATEVLVTTTTSTSGIRQVLTTTTGTLVSDASITYGTAQKADLQQSQRARLGRLGWKEIIR